MLCVGGAERLFVIHIVVKVMAVEVMANILLPGKEEVSDVSLGSLGADTPR